MENEETDKNTINLVNEENESNLEFKEPEWMKILTRMLENRMLQKSIQPKDI